MKNPSRLWEGGNVRGWEAIERNGFQWSQENAGNVVLRGDGGNISWGSQDGHPGNNDEEVMVQIIL